MGSDNKKILVLCSRIWKYPVGGSWQTTFGKGQVVNTTGLQVIGPLLQLFNFAIVEWKQRIMHKQLSVAMFQ